MAHLGSNEAEEEEKHFKTIIAAYKSYERDSKDRLKKSEASLKAFPLEDQLVSNINVCLKIYPLIELK
jgi:hypothetical protein